MFGGKKSRKSKKSKKSKKSRKSRKYRKSRKSRRGGKYIGIQYKPENSNKYHTWGPLP